jgi:hypothetical protein
MQIKNESEKKMYSEAMEQIRIWPFKVRRYNYFLCDLTFKRVHLLTPLGIIHF